MRFAFSEKLWHACCNFSVVYIHKYKLMWISKHKLTKRRCWVKLKKKSDNFNHYKKKKTFPSPQQDLFLKLVKPRAEILLEFNFHISSTLSWRSLPHTELALMLSQAPKSKVRWGSPGAAGLCWFDLCHGCNLALLIHFQQSSLELQGGLGMQFRFSYPKSNIEPHICVD